MNQLQNQVVLAALTSYLIEVLKRSQRIPWVNEQTTRLNRALTILLSGLSALGIHIVCSKLNHSCILTWSDGLTIATVLWKWVQQFVFTHAWHKAMHKQ